MPTTENWYQGEAMSDRSMPKTSHGTANSKIGIPSVMAMVTRCDRWVFMAESYRTWALLPLVARMVVDQV
jgi:hypothetical protein